MSNTKALYALSGDPVTNGHVWVIERALLTFDRLVVAIAENPAKRYTFGLAARATMLKAAVPDPPASLTFTTILPGETTVRVAKQTGATVLVRGVRNAADCAYELSLAHFNAKLEPGVHTVWVPTPAALADVSSSFVKRLVGLDGWEEVVRDLVPPVVLDYLGRWHRQRQSTAKESVCEYQGD